MNDTTSLAEIARGDLAGLKGGIVGPGDPGYDEARAVHNGMIDRRPAVIVRCSSAEDVGRTIAFARAHDAPIAVRGGGHNGGGLGVVDDGVVIDLAGMGEVVVDPDADTVRVGGGCTWGRGRPGDGGVRPRDAVGDHLDDRRRRADARRRHRPPDARASASRSTACSGPTWSSPTARRYTRAPTSTPTCSGRCAVAAATSASSRRSSSAPTRSALTVMAGPTFWPIEQTPEVMRFYRDFLPAAPRAVNGFFALMTVPPVDLFPEELHLRKVCAVMWCVVGSEEEATQLLAPVHDVGTPLLHGVGPMPHPALQSLFDGLYTKGLQCYWRADFFDELSDELIEQHLEWGAEAAVDALDDAPLPDRRRGSRRRQPRRPPSATATRNGPRSSSGSTPIRPTRTRSATGASATGMRPIPTRPAAPTSTS